MSEKTTRIRIVGSPGFIIRGHVTYSEAVADAERHYRQVMQDAQHALESIRHGRFQVLHQRGIYRARNIHVVQPDNGRRET